jgi:hypothetical protein
MELIDIDWSKAPEDATHHGRGEDCCYWAKCVDGQQYFINISGWDNGNWKPVTERYDYAFLTARPKSEWTGEGLPPVGVEFEWRYVYHAWKRGEALYIGSVYVILKDCNEEQHYYLRDMQFRPIRTPEQIAAEERDRCVQKMAKELEESDHKHGSLYALYDLGYRKFEIVEE